MLNYQPVHYNVVIIGAGAAGLGAGRELQSKGIDSFIILEASSRIGGRIKTSRTESGVAFDLGAQWLHGECGNSIYFLSQGQNLLREELSADGGGDFYSENGKKISKEIVEDVLDVMAEISEECKIFFELSDYKDPKILNTEFISNIESTVSKRNWKPFDYSKEGVSVGSFYKERFKEYLNSCKSDSQFDKMSKKSLFNWILRWELIDNACDSLYDISAKRWGEYIMCSGRNNMNPIDGMITLLNRAREGIPPSKILFCKNVIGICYDLHSHYNGRILLSSRGEAPIIIQCRDGTMFHCDHVIVTVSLGVLKANLDMFKPALPLNIHTAITSIGYGNLDKIFLEFPYEWWSKDFIGLQFIWTANTLRNEDDDQKNEEWFRGITGFDAIPGKKNLLCGWIGGKDAAQMETIDADDVKRVCVQLLRQFSGRENIPGAIAIYRSSWHTDPLFLGSYSHRLTRTEQVSSQELNVPICTSSEEKIPLIVFAGEANNLHFFSTVHGAFDNGVEQSRHYINHRRKRFSVPKSRL